MNNFEQHLIEKLFHINEIGDTQKGKDFIRRSFDKRSKQHDDAVEAGKTAYKDYPPSEKDTFRVQRAKLQLQKVAHYMNKKQDHEDTAEHNPEGVAAYKDYRKKLAVHPKTKQKRDIEWEEPKTKEALKKDMGDYGARRGRQDYREEYGEEETRTRKRLKGLGVKGPTSKGMEKALSRTQQKNRDDNWRMN